LGSKKQGKFNVLLPKLKKYLVDGKNVRLVNSSSKCNSGMELLEGKLEIASSLFDGDIEELP